MLVLVVIILVLFAAYLGLLVAGQRYVVYDNRYIPNMPVKACFTYKGSVRWIKRNCSITSWFYTQYEGKR